MSDKDDLIYDEDDSVAFIQNYLPQELKMDNEYFCLCL